jgi:glycosyltransferase involved in cell wall biosynthesis
MPVIAHYIRNWDALSASRVDYYIANSATVAARVERYYRRESKVIYPPVDVDAFNQVPDDEVGDYYLMVGELVGYKRSDLAVHAFNQTGKALVIIGGGEMLQSLKKIAGDNITILGPQPFSVLKHHYARCRALIFPGEEDFGIVPVEAMASGRPVIAYRRGGATETVIDNVTGVFFDEQSVEAIVDAVTRSEQIDFQPSAIAEHARTFSTTVFEREISAYFTTILPTAAAPLVEAVPTSALGLVPGAPRAAASD